MDLNDSAQRAVEELGATINRAVEDSPQVADAIERLRLLGFEMELTLRLEIGLRNAEVETADDLADDQEVGELKLTDEDLQILRRMKIGLGTDE